MRVLSFTRPFPLCCKSSGFILRYVAISGSPKLTKRVKFWDNLCVLIFKSASVTGTPFASNNSLFRLRLHSFAYFLIAASAPSPLSTPRIWRNFFCAAIALACESVSISTRSCIIISAIWLGVRFDDNNSLCRYIRFFVLKAGTAVNVQSVISTPSVILSVIHSGLSIILSLHCSTSASPKPLSLSKARASLSFSLSSVVN